MIKLLFKIITGIKFFRRGVSFAEIVVAVTVFAIMAIPVYMSMSGVQTDTVKSISYLRAVELANEAIDYVRLIPVDTDFKMKAEGLSGSILIEKPDFAPAPVMTGDNPYYKDILADKLTYSEQYNPSFFYRTVEVGDLSGTSYSGLLKKVVVTIYWDDGRSVKNIHDLNSKTRKVVMACLITDWRSQP
ncbi:MAG: type IV pilus modification PilV family protein [Candidatus Rifleibacteriota bacterium]